MDCDYVKFMIITDPDEFARKYATFYEAAERAAAGGPVQAKMTALGSGQQQYANRRRYVLEAWGKTADCYWRLPVAWRVFLVRFDVKFMLPEWTDSDAVNLWQRWNVYDTVRNKQSFSSRHRSKKNGRSAGGKGFALGSHKSDMRLSVYRRSQQDWGFETQLTGRKLRQLVLRVLNERERDGMVDGVGFWSDLLVEAHWEGMEQAMKSAGLSGRCLPKSVKPLDSGLFGEMPF